MYLPRIRSLLPPLLILLFLATSACSKIVYEHNDGRLSRGTFYFMKNIYYQGQFEEEENPQKRNQAIVNDRADLDGVGALATRKGLKKDAYYHEYMFRQEHARHGKAAIWYWQQKYKEKFNWQMLFAAEKLAYDEQKTAKLFEETRRGNGKYDDLLLAEFEGQPVYYRDLKPVVTVSDYQQFPGYSGAALLSGLREALKSLLEKKIHDRVVKNLFADETELKRLDHNRVAALYLKVKYAKAGKGIYPTHMDKIPLTPMEVYDHFHRMQNSLADVLWVKAAYTVVAEESLADELKTKLDKGEDFAQLAVKYGSEPRFKKTGVPRVIQGYNRKSGIDAREGRDYYDRLILDMAGRDVTKPEPYLGKDGIVIVRIYDVSRALEKIQLSEVNWKVENDLRIKLLNAVYEEDVRDARKKLNIVFNERLIRSLQ